MKKLKLIIALLITISMMFSFVACKKRVIYIDESNADESESDHITDSTIDESESDHITDSSIDESESDHITDSNIDESESDHITTDSHLTNPQYPPVEERDYSIEYIDGKYYYVFEQPERYIGLDYDVTGVSREDWREFRYDLLYGELSIYEKIVIANGSTWYGGNFECPDYYNFYGPVVPEDMTVYGEMYIYGEYYSIGVVRDDGACTGVYVLTKNSYDRLYKNLHNIIFADETMESYTLQDDSKFMKVDKVYKKGEFHNAIVYGEQYGRYFIVQFYAGYFGKEPTDEWLLSFGLELYASENE